MLLNVNFILHATKTCSLNEIVLIKLQDQYCVRILQYTTAPVKLTKAQISDLNVCWNFVCRQNLGFYQHESVRSFIYGVGSLEFPHIRLLLVYKLII